MKTVGFPISRKENEKRRALLIQDIDTVKNKQLLFFESGYGDDYGFNDEELRKKGCNVVNHEEVLTKEIIIDAKIGDAEYLNDLRNQTIFGWVHAVQNKAISDVLIKNNLTVYAWEDMYKEQKHVFWRNNELAGEAAIMHAFQCYGKMPYNTKVALLGRGNVALGALKILTLLGAEVTVYSSKTEKLFKKEFQEYDVIVNAVLWETKRKDHILYKSDLAKMKKGSMIIDISCDKNGGIESSIPTTIEEPFYILSGVMHYVVDHTPSLFYKSSSESISKEVSKYIDDLCDGRNNLILNQAKCIERGKIIDKRIIEFQQREEIK